MNILLKNIISPKQFEQAVKSFKDVEEDPDFDFHTIFKRNSIVTSENTHHGYMYKFYFENPYSIGEATYEQSYLVIERM